MKSICWLSWWMHEHQLLLGTKTLNDLMHFKTHAGRVKSLLCSLTWLIWWMSTSYYRGLKHWMPDVLYFKTHASSVESLLCFLPANSTDERVPASASSGRYSYNLLRLTVNSYRKRSLCPRNSHAKVFHYLVKVFSLDCQNHISNVAILHHRARVVTGEKHWWMFVWIKYCNNHQYVCVPWECSI